MIPDEVKKMHQKKIGEKLGHHPRSVENPNTILCTLHNDQFVAGTDIKLKTGDNKYRYLSQGGAKTQPAQQRGNQKPTAERRLQQLREKKYQHNRARRARVKAKKEEASAVGSAQTSEQTSQNAAMGGLCSVDLETTFKTITLLQGMGMMNGGADASSVVESPAEVEQTVAKQVKFDTSDPMVKLAMSLQEAQSGGDR